MNNLPMTPFDCVELYSCIKKNASRKNERTRCKKMCFQVMMRLSLDDAREYEGLLKNKLF